MRSSLARRSRSLVRTVGSPSIRHASRLSSKRRDIPTGHTRTPRHAPGGSCMHIPRIHHAHLNGIMRGMTDTLRVSLSQLSARLFFLGFLLALALGIHELSAWTAPTQTPPNCVGCTVPLHTGSGVQVKAGGLQASTVEQTGTSGVSLVEGKASFWTGAIVNPTYTIDMDDLDPATANGIRFPDGTVQTTAGGFRMLGQGVINGGSNATVASGFSLIIVQGGWVGGDGCMVQGMVTNDGTSIRAYSQVCGADLNGVTLTSGATETCTRATSETVNNLCFRNSGGAVRIRPGSSGSAMPVHYVAF